MQQNLLIIEMTVFSLVWSGILPQSKQRRFTVADRQAVMNQVMSHPSQRIGSNAMTFVLT